MMTTNETATFDSLYAERFAKVEKTYNTIKAATNHIGINWPMVMVGLGYQEVIDCGDVLIIRHIGETFVITK